MLALIVIVVGGFLSMLSFGSARSWCLTSQPRQTGGDGQFGGAGDADRQLPGFRAPPRLGRSARGGSASIRGSTDGARNAVVAALSARSRSCSTAIAAARALSGRPSSPRFPARSRSCSTAIAAVTPSISLARALEALLCHLKAMRRGWPRGSRSSRAGRRLCRRQRQCGGGQHASAFRGQLDARRDGWYQGEPVDPYPLLAGKTASR